MIKKPIFAKFWNFEISESGQRFSWRFSRRSTDQDRTTFIRKRTKLRTKVAKKKMASFALARERERFSFTKISAKVGSRQVFRPKLEIFQSSMQQIIYHSKEHISRNKTCKCGTEIRTHALTAKRQSLRRPSYFNQRAACRAPPGYFE